MTGRSASDTLTRWTVTAVMAVIALLAFVFSFGNVWTLALHLGVPRPIAPLIAPMVDLSVVGLLVALRHLSLHGIPETDLRPATRLMHLCGLLTLALNIAEPLTTHHWGRAALDTVAPLLLLGWGKTGPLLLRHLHTTTPTLAQPTADLPPSHSPEATTPVPSNGVETQLTAPTRVRAHPAVPAALLGAARTIAADHRTVHGTAITPGELRARLGVPQPLASAVHAALA